MAAFPCSTTFSDLVSFFTFFFVTTSASTIRSRRSSRSPGPCNVQRWGRRTQRRIHSVSDVAIVLLPLLPERHREPHSLVNDKVTHRGWQTYLSLATCKPKSSEVQNGGQTRTPKCHRLNCARKISSRSTYDDAERNQIMPLTIPELIPEQPKPNSKVFQPRGRENPASDAYQV
jgi:hypothetical protein